MFWGATKVSLSTSDRVIIETCPFKATGFEYQIEEVMSCISKGKKESDVMPLEQTLNNIKLMDGIRKEIGLKYSFE
jgi:hypothetical protein